MGAEVSIYLVYILFFAAALIFSILINRVFVKFSKNLGMRNLPEGTFRWRTQKPALGGISFFILFLISFSVYAILPFKGEAAFNKQLVGIVFAVALGFLIGLTDDAYNTNPLLKFIGQFTCANILLSTGIMIEISPSYSFNYFFTTIWVIGIMNSINMLDNMDGVAAVSSLIIVLAAFCFGIFFDLLDRVYLLPLLAVAAALIGFLIYNWHPSKIFMGDTGSQFLGVFLSAIAILVFWNFQYKENTLFQLQNIIFPFMIFIVPLIDTFTVIIRRAARGQSPFVGGKDHITHHLAYLGMSEGTVAACLAAFSLISIIILFLFLKLVDQWNTLHYLFFVIYWIVSFLIMQVFYNKGKRNAELNK